MNGSVAAMAEIAQQRSTVEQIAAFVQRIRFADLPKGPWSV
ncbi:MULTISPECIES: hypothetical protein [Paraburkholderia]|nr:MULTISPECIES: hypothetical protein [Paraburkholderia]MDH6148158.1 hypothetical protein [Paraburkholderia sp. WSM4179]